MQRVSAIKGYDSSILIIVPHGHDDPNTSIIGETIIKELNCYGVINYGWERDKTFDYNNDKANCNNIDHIHNIVIEDEFLDPILKFTNKIRNTWREEKALSPNIFIIHGVSNSVRSTDSELDFIVGYGAGYPERLTCPIWYKNEFMSQLKKRHYIPYQGKSGGSYSGWTDKNLNQLFTSSKYKNANTWSLQIEIVKELRSTKTKAISTGLDMALCIEDVVEERENPDLNNLWQTINANMAATSPYFFPEI